MFTDETNTTKTEEVNLEETIPIYKTNYLIPCAVIAVPTSLSQQFKTQAVQVLPKYYQTLTPPLNSFNPTNIKDFNEYLSKFDWKKLKEIKEKIKPLASNN